MIHWEQVAMAALAWMLMGNAMRFAAVGGHAMVPVMRAGWAVLWRKGNNSRDCARRFADALDGLYIRLMAALTTTASGALVYSGIFFTGVGMAIRVSGSVLRYTEKNDLFWQEWSKWQNIASTPLIVVGMSCIIAAVSPRRTASLWMSAGFVFAGIGIGMVTTSSVFQ